MNKIKKYWVWIIIGLILIGAAISYPIFRVEEKSLPIEVSAQKAYELRDDGAFVLDVRERDEWETVRIPEANWIPLGELSGNLTQIPYDQKIVIYCRSGNRSATARNLLLKEGYTEVTSLRGGINSWISEGFDTSMGK